MSNATWPFAKLSVSPGKLELNASVIGNLVFRPKDIISLEPYYSMSQGIRIRHRVANYKTEVIFWSGNAVEFIKQIHAMGFFDAAHTGSPEQEQEIMERQRSGGAPFKKAFVIGFGVVWNLLFLADIIPFILAEHKVFPLRYGAFTAIASSLILAILLFISDPVRKLILKKGRTVRDVSRFLVLIIIICVFMLSIMSLFLSIGK